ncbi:MAG: hypothetical protein LBQ22_09150 [Bacteroidales bacterium]|jgi:uncharacterized protein YfaS (alpha-2-macroglobulin family)|nr:hypothetical protein [Bacteroidales bacterium]
MKPILVKFILFLSTLLFSAEVSEKNIISYIPAVDYEKHWKEVEKLENDALPQSALKKVLEIYDLAVSENNEKQIIKSVIYRLKYIRILEEDGYEKSILKLEEELSNYDGATRAFMHSLLAVMYDDYYNKNVYRINNRSETFNFENTDIKTWDKSKIKDKVIKNFTLALDERLKDIGIAEYSEIIINASKVTEDFPTLYDFVAYYAVEKLSATYNPYWYFDAGNEDKLADISYLNDMESFIELPVDGDSLSYNNTIIKIYQKWLNFRLQDEKNIDALISTDIKRLNFVKNNLSESGVDKAWENTIDKLKERFKDYPEVSAVNHELASYYNELGNRYDFREQGTFRYKLYKVKAISLLDEALERFPASKYVPDCQNLKNEIEKPYFSFQIDKISVPKQKIPVRISFTNTDSLYFSVLKCDYDDYMSINASAYEEKYVNEIKKISKTVRSGRINLPQTSDYNEHYTEYLIEPLEHGFYIIFFHATPKLSIDKNYLANSAFFISDLSITSNSFRGSEYYVFDRNTGKPVEGASVDVFRREYDYKKSEYIYIKDATYKTNKNGFVDLKDSHKGRFLSVRINVKKGDDIISEGSYLNMYDNADPVKHCNVSIYTDRAIYRPGQTVYFKGIAINYDGDNREINTNYYSDVKFFDVNRQLISSVMVKSNEFGSFNGSFEIPLGVLPGSFEISCSGGSKYIRVEEYKRPMFEISVLPVEGEYRYNDTVTVDAMAVTYAGTPLTDAKITYNIERLQNFGSFMRGYSMETKEICSGVSEIGEDGKFKIKFAAVADVQNDDGLNKYIYYTYRVNISVTDINGETQTTSTSVNVSYKALEISESIKPIELKEQMDSIIISAVNPSGMPVPANVEIEIVKLKNQEKLLTGKNWEIIDLPMYSQSQWYKEYPGYEYGNENDFTTWKPEKSMFKTNINTSVTSKIKPDNVENWTSGVYRIIMQSKDKWGNTILYSNEFILFSVKDKKTPYKATNFFISDKTSAQPGETVNVYFGSEFKDVHILYELEFKGKIQKTEIIKLNSEVKKLEIPITEDCRGGVTANFMFIKNGRIYTYKLPISVAWKNKELDIKLITFRDKTLPGAAENWKLKITDNNSQPQNAELMATLYDASLDIFAKNQWILSLQPTYSSILAWQNYNFTANSSYQYFKDFYKNELTRLVYLPQLNLFGLADNMRGYYMNKLYGINSESIDYMVVEEYSAAVEEESVQASPRDSRSEADYASADMAVGGGALEQTTAQVQIRKNFAETAFFYPALVTDKNGELFLSFTMPESLTRWNFMGLAHTKDLKVGQISETIVTQKELMVMPNLPRFFRENDKMTISVKINNVASENISGIAKIEFFDAETLKSLTDIFLGTTSATTNFDVESDKNTSVEWNISVPVNISTVGVRITAEGKNHSDGEERILPVLTNSMLVTETLPLPVRKSGTSNFTMDKLKNSNSSSTLRNYNFTLEYTSNPAWYAVQALPYLMEYPYECAEQLFSRYYANSLATHIANSDPKIKRVFDLWKTTPGSEALLSNLEKNQELKSLLLEETPWLLNAKNETERKHRLGLLFDLNKMTQERNSALRKLRETQQYNGGWPWFKGMPENWYISQYIVTGFGHLNKLGVYDIKEDNETWNMVENAVRFIDSKLEESYNHLKKNCDKKCMEGDNLSYTHIQYLYARSFFINDIPVSSSVKEAMDYYKGQAEKYWKSKSFYMQGMIALSLNRFGNSDIPKKVIASLKEHAIHNEEMGMYWKYNNGYYWYQAPVETQALLIEAFDEITNDQASVEEMKVWLLKQKQTQDWKTTKATAEAIYALLLKGTDLLKETDFPEIKIGDMLINVSDPEIKTEAGTGYFKKTWNGTDIKPEWGNVSITKAKNTVSWGAVYWQYFEQLDKITEFEDTPLKINKKLFVERREGGKPVIIPVENDGKLSVGDKIKVRIEIRSDRDMEYVHLKDMRASCFEPVDYISGYRYKSGLGYYQAIKDASMNFFIDYLRKGTYVFEYDLVVSQKGDFSNGITTIQCMYAPEFSSHSEGVRVSVE